MDKEEDPFASIIKHCIPTSSQESKFQNCHFLRQFDFSPNTTPSPSSSSGPYEPSVDPTGIIMVSPPDSSIAPPNDDEEDDDVFGTPPEHSHSLQPLSTSSEDPQFNGGNHRIDDEVTSVDGFCTHAERVIDLGEECDNNLGFLESDRKINDGDAVLRGDCGGFGGVDVVFERELEEFRVFEGESREGVSKKIRVSEENLGIECPDVLIGDTERIIVENEPKGNGETEILEVEFEEIGGGFGLNRNSMSVSEKGGECNGTHTILDLGEESDNNLAVSEPRSTQRNDVSGGKFSGFEGESREGISKKFKVSKENLGIECPDGHMDDTEPIIVEKDPNGVGETDILQFEFEQAGGGLGLNEDVVNVDLRSKECSKEGVRVREGKRIRGKGEERLGSKSIEEIEKFKYVGSGGVDWRRKAKGGGGRRELPFSMRGQEENLGGEKESRGEAAKNQALKDLLDALKMVVEGEGDDGSVDFDFLATAKKRGMVFPRPRWWPPEGFEA